jgi:hypothetical protein
MLTKENDPAFAIFVDGMEGDPQRVQGVPRAIRRTARVAFRAPGGEARELADELAGSQAYRRVNAGDLLRSAEYGALMDDVLADAQAGWNT